jgi:hypothetical protein
VILVCMCCLQVDLEFKVFCLGKIALRVFWLVYVYVG